jgi:hypothetical protein
MHVLSPGKLLSLTYPSYSTIAFLTSPLRDAKGESVVVLYVSYAAPEAQAAAAALGKKACYLLPRV